MHFNGATNTATLLKERRSSDKEIGSKGESIFVTTLSLSSSSYHHLIFLQRTENPKKTLWLKKVYSLMCMWKKVVLVTCFVWFERNKIRVQENIYQLTNNLCKIKYNVRSFKLYAAAATQHFKTLRTTTTTTLACCSGSAISRSFFWEKETWWNLRYSYLIKQEIAYHHSTQFCLWLVLALYFKTLYASLHSQLF